MDVGTFTLIYTTRNSITINLGYKPKKVLMRYMHANIVAFWVHYDESISSTQWIYGYNPVNGNSAYGTLNLNTGFGGANLKFNVTSTGFTFSTGDSSTGSTSQPGWYMASRE